MQDMKNLNRKHNFSAGPCTLPLEVLQEVQAEFVDYQGSGMSLMEMSHRGSHFMQVASDATQLAKAVFNVPDDFTVLMLQGGATMQFSMLPLNLLHNGMRAAYVNSGTWANGAITDAKCYGEVYTAWSGEAENFSRMPASDEIQIQDNTRYLHITSNETIGGIRFYEWPDVDVPLVADMSSEFMARPIPWEKFDIVYGGLQKNLGPAGMALVFIRSDILSQCNQSQGRYLRYDIHAQKESMFNTPPVFAIYMLGKVLKWMESQGGVLAMQQQAQQKSSLIYNVIDNSHGFYQSPVEVKSRSHMNVVFRLPNDNLEKAFLEESAQADLVNLKGHRSVGGCRASLYNALPLNSAQALAEFMQYFQRKHQL